MLIQHQNGIPPNDILTDKKYHSLLCLQPLQRNPDLLIYLLPFRPPQFAFCKCKPAHYTLSTKLSSRHMQVLTNPNQQTFCFSLVGRFNESKLNKVTFHKKFERK